VSQVTTGVRSVLSRPDVYKLWSRVVGAQRAHTVFINQHVRPASEARILDLGCGTGELADCLPSGASYCGVDISEEYVARANERLGCQANVHVGDASAITADLGRFDLVVAYGLLHHLDDEQARTLFRNAACLLSAGGRVVTADPVRTMGQSHARRTLMSRDRGQHIRTSDGYAALADPAFGAVRSTVYHDLLRIPYSHCVLECDSANITAQ
jgi:cyclopropane fatty-acyl-phospholipid synthase-like methyltransferase